MPFTQPGDLPEIKITDNPDKANYQNFLVWQAQHEARKRDSITQFNLFQTRSRDRVCSHALYKEESEQQTDALKDLVERRLSNACECSDCGQVRERSNSEESFTAPSSPTTSVRSSTSSLGSTLTNTSSSGSARGPSGKNSLIVSPPPRSRHHKRRAQTTSP